VIEDKITNFTGTSAIMTHIYIDHIVIAVHDLDAAIQHYRAQGFTVTRGGVHANRATHNALITLADSTYLELLAPTGEAPIPDLLDFSVLLPGPELDSPGGAVVGFALHSDDLDADVIRLRKAGFAVSDVMPGERRREDGTLVQWKLALLDGGFAPFLIQDVTPRHLRVPNSPALTAHTNGVVGLHHVDLAVDDLAAAQAQYAGFDGVALHETEPDQALGSLAVHVTLTDGSIRKLNEVTRA
jgi:catechol 2,3-dioxygenase-like lactoylglutathione lyase family enzyme